MNAQILSAVMSRMVSGAMVGSMLGLVSYAIAGKPATLNDVKVSTEYVSQDEQMKDVIIQLKTYITPTTQEAFNRIVSISDAIVYLYVDLMQEMDQNRTYVLRNQVKAQELQFVLDKVVETFRTGVIASSPQDAQDVEELLQSLSGICSSYIDNIFTDSLEQAGGDHDYFDELESRVRG